MNEIDSSEHEAYGTLEYWKMKPPEEVLEAFINELRGPHSSIKGWIKIMQMDQSQEMRLRALDTIFKTIERIEKVEELIKDYLVEFKKRSTED